jgi:hypothetical protein
VRKQAIYVLHPTLGLRTAIFMSQLLVNGDVSVVAFAFLLIIGHGFLLKYQLFVVCQLGLEKYCLRWRTYASVQIRTTGATYHSWFCLSAPILPTICRTRYVSFLCNQLDSLLSVVLFFLSWGMPPSDWDEFARFDKPEENSRHHIIIYKLQANNMQRLFCCYTTCTC